MSKKSKSKHQHPTTQPEQGGTNKESANRHVYVEPGAKIDFVQDLRDKYDTAQTDDHTHKTKQLFWTKVAAVLLLITAGFAGWQGHSTRKSADAAKEAADIAKDAMLRGQRPWIAIEREPTMKITANNAETLLVIRNVGNSPALHLSYSMKPLSLSDAYKDSKAKSEFYCHFAEGYIGNIPDSTLPSLGGVVFPNKTFTLHDTSESTAPIKDSFAVMGCVAYVDQFYDSPAKSQIHHTGFCFYYTPPQELLKPVTVDMTLMCNFGQIAD